MTVSFVFEQFAILINKKIFIHLLILFSNITVKKFTLISYLSGEGVDHFSAVKIDILCDCGYVVTSRLLVFYHS